MTFDLTTIFIAVLLALAYSILLPAAWRGWALMIASVIAIYWLQPLLAIRFMDYILPTAMLVIIVLVWWFTRLPDDPEQRAKQLEDGIALAVISAVAIGMALMRFVDADLRLTASRPPNPLWVVVGLGVVALPVTALSWRREYAGRTWTAIIVLIIALFAVLKAEPLAEAVAGWLRGRSGQNTALASVADLSWLGFSYVAFRLIHIPRDRQKGLLPALSLREFITYVIFFPAFIAGPIDRAERFVGDLQALPQQTGLDAPRFYDGGGRIATGLFKKFVVADTLAQGLSLNAINAAQTDSVLGLWALLYGYALRLFFDFSGYSDIAIGVGILFGVRLPDNFNRPYLKRDITSFWQSWHMTLSNWARFYVFTPLSRALLRHRLKPSPVLIVLAAQLATMAVIGLWHGITVNFLVWGVWHGLALFVHKQWSDRTRKWYRGLKAKPLQGRLWAGFAWALTLHYVVIGWVWFTLPDFDQALDVMGGLVGIGI